MWERTWVQNTRRAETGKIGCRSQSSDRSSELMSSTPGWVSRRDRFRLWTPRATQPTAIWISNESSSAWVDWWAGPWTGEHRGASPKRAAFSQVSALGRAECQELQDSIKQMKLEDHPSFGRDAGPPSIQRDRERHTGLRGSVA